MTDRNARLMAAAARIGYGARGFAYLLIGGLALLAALDLGGRAVGTRGALRTLLDQPFGTVLLGLLAAGFLCFAFWRVIQAVADPGHYGRALKGLGIRAALGASAILYASFSFFALRLALGWAQEGAVGATANVQYWVATVLSAPFGRAMVGLAGTAVIGLGVTKALKGWRTDFEDNLVCGAHIRRWAVPLSRFGLIARALVFMLAGISVVVAAIRVEAEDAAGLAGVLRALDGGVYGWVLLTMMALGLAAFGVFALMEALYRRIDAPDLD